MQEQRKRKPHKKEKEERTTKREPHGEENKNERAKGLPPLKEIISVCERGKKNKRDFSLVMRHTQKLL